MGRAEACVCSIGECKYGHSPVSDCINRRARTEDFLLIFCPACHKYTWHDELDWICQVCGCDKD